MLDISNDIDKLVSDLIRNPGSKSHKTMTVEVNAALHPLKIERVTHHVAAGHTIAEIFEQIQPDPMLRESAHIFIGKHYIARQYWSQIRPKPGTQIAVRAFIPPTGGANGKDILRTVLLIAVVVSASVFGAGLGAALGFSGALAASVGQTVIGLGGMLAVNALVPPRPAAATTSAASSQVNFISGANNAADPFGSVPVFFGFNKYTPKLGAEWVTEIVGDDQYLRGIMVVGIAPLNLDVSKFKIGDTLLSAFTDVQIEVWDGYANFDTITLYPNTIDQQNFAILLQEVDGYTIRTTDENADEISVDVVFPNGLVSVDSSGNQSAVKVAIEVEYSVSGANSWQHIPTAGGVQTFDLSLTNKSGGSFNTITFNQKSTDAVRHSFTWNTPARGTYDVRIKRLTADSSVDTIQDEIQWTALRRIENIDPINSLVPVVKIAIRIKATDQLNGVIDDFSAYPEFVALDWDISTSTWILRPTQNPAAAFRAALQGNGLQVPYADSALDLTMLQYWSAYCTTQGFKYNQPRDFQSTVWDMLCDIAASGRASPTNIDGKYSVVIDEPKTAVQHITPRNSTGFKASKLFADQPHAFRVQFNNEQKDFANDEIRVYLDGYDETNATKFETATYPGVTDPDLITKHARFAYSCAINRPEVWSFSQDMERMVYRRGDVTLVTHDVLLIGIAFGRIKSVIVDGDGNALGAVVDENLPMDADISYGLSIRTVAEIGLLAPLINSPGDNKTVMFVTPIDAADAPMTDNLFGFGEVGTETDSAIILTIDPASGAGYNAAITAVPYRTIVYDIDAGPIPPFNSNITTLDPVPSVEVLQVRSDETTLTISAGSALSVHINIKVQSINTLGATLDVQIRPSTTAQNFVPAQIDNFVNNEVSIGNVITGEYVDIQLRWLVPDRLPGPLTTLFNQLVVGKSTDPLPLQDLTISIFGGQAYMRWSTPTELDVLFGGTVYFRHSSDATPEWGTSVSIGDVAQAKSLLATLPLKAGTYIARVFDDANNQSDVVMVNTKQASVLTYGPVDTLDEAPTFTGTMVDVTLDGAALILSEDGAFWDALPDIDATPDIDGYGSVAAEAIGTYTFANGFDFGSVTRIRLTTRLTVAISLIADDMDDWQGNIDDRDDFDGDNTAQCDCKVYVSLTDDDPNGLSPTWTDYQRVDSTEIEARGCRFLSILTSSNTDFNIAVSVLGVDAEAVT